MAGLVVSAAGAETYALSSFDLGQSPDTFLELACEILLRVEPYEPPAASFMVLRQNSRTKFSWRKRLEPAANTEAAFNTNTAFGSHCTRAVRN